MIQTLFILLFLLSPIYSEEGIGYFKLESIDSEPNTFLENLLQEKIIEYLTKSKFTPIYAGELNPENLEKLSDSSQKFALGGFYKKKKNQPIEIFLQIYSTKQKKIIDALSSTFPSIDGLNLDNNEVQKLDNEIIEEISKKIVLQIKLNPNGNPQDIGINESILNKPISKKLEPFLKPIDEESTKNIFSFVQKSFETETASRSKQNVFNSPATVVVITEEDIKARGYTDIVEVLSDVPGFDVIHSNGAPYAVPYMRGYRSFFGEKILLMIDGKENRTLYNQNPRISRQFPMSSIKKIEILYGPSSVVYGRNAMQGIINIITKNGSEHKTDGNQTTVQLQHGSFQTSAIDTNSNGKIGDFTYSGSLKYFRSDEADLSNRIYPSYLNNSYYNNKYTWGPILDADINGNRFGRYYDPSLNQTYHLNMAYKGARIGYYKEKISEGFGAAYTGDKAQNNSTWGTETGILYAEYDKEIGDKFRSFTQIVKRQNDILGTWTESLPSKKLPLPYNSNVSSTNWLAQNSTFDVLQIIDFKFSRNFSLSGGLNYSERKLAREYDIPGYYNSYSSSLPNDKVNYPNGYSVVPSSSSTLPMAPLPIRSENPSNIALFRDYGAYAIGNIDINKFRLSGGVRYDKNSFYGSNISPRITGIYRFSDKNSFKTMYGEAFNEPTQQQIYGDSGGATYYDYQDTEVGNKTLKAEKMRSGEIAYLFLGKQIFTEIGSFYNSYSRTIELDIQNIYGKKTYGGEWKVTYNTANILSKSKSFQIYFNYTYTESLNGIKYSQYTRIPTTGTTFLGQYEDFYNSSSYSSIPLPRSRSYFHEGDIAKNKFNIGFNLPIGDRINVNLRGNYIGQRGLYTTNPLRNKGVLLDPYFIVNSTFSVYLDNFGTISIKVYNLFNQYYKEPGVERADGGDNFTSRSIGYRNSILPQPERYFLMLWTLEL